jgi:hypothetical protein
MMYLSYKAKVIAALFMLPVIFTSISLQAQDANDIRDLVQMPLAVDKAVKAGLSARDVETIARSMRDGRMPPHEFNQTLRDVSYIAAERGPEGVQDIGNHASAAVRDGLRGQELARSIHTRLQSLGIPAGGRNGQGPSPMAQDFIPDHARDRIRQRQNASGGDRGRRDESAGERNAGQGQRDDAPGPNPRNRMEQQSPGGPDYRDGGPGAAGGRPGGRP